MNVDSFGRAVLKYCSWVQVASEMLMDEKGRPQDIALMFLFITIGGIIMSLTEDPDPALTGFYKYISNAFGCMYLLAWSVSYWPQLLLNFKLQNTIGLSVDFVLVNFIGYVSMAIYNLLMFSNGAVRTAYRKTHDGEDNNIQSDDVVLSVQCSILLLANIYQIATYTGFGVQKPSKPYTILFYFLFAYTAIYAFLIILTDGGMAEFNSEKCVYKSIICEHLNWLNFVFWLSIIKLISTLSKYLPQVMLNQKRRSTSGFNIWAIALDIYGAIFSFCQVIGDGINMGDVPDFKDAQFAKLYVGLFTLMFDTVLLLQHYVWFKSESKAAAEYGILDETDDRSFSSIGSISERRQCVLLERLLNDESSTVASITRL